MDLAQKRTCDIVSRRFCAVNRRKTEKKEKSGKAVQFFPKIGKIDKIFSLCACESTGIVL